MIKFDDTEVMNFEGAFRGMRNSLESLELSDSKFYELGSHPLNTLYKMPINQIGENDIKLAQKLIKAGSDHRKFLRQIFVSVDITAPLYWWKEFDTYKVSTVSNSCSTMHKIHAKEFTLDDFSVEKLMTVVEERVMKQTIDVLNELRDVYNNFDEMKENNELIEDANKKRYLVLDDPAFTEQLQPKTYNHVELRNFI